VVALAVRGWLPAPLDQLLCAAVLLFWLGTGRGPQREQHEALLVAFAVRGLLSVPWPAAVRSGLTVFGSVHAEARDVSSTSCSSFSRCTACCRRLGHLLCAAVLMFFARRRPDPQREQHELLVAFAVRGLLPAPWPAAMRSGGTVFGSAQAEARNESSTRCWSLRWCAACWRRLDRLRCAVTVLFLARYYQAERATTAARAAGRFRGARLVAGALVTCCA
jgi:hypothetical protein